MVDGVCKLTGEKGPFVRSHIIPRALTLPEERGRPFAQAGRDYAPRTRRDSWYDTALVTRSGEDVLAAYDDWAIRELRRHRLVWSGWGKDDELSEKEMMSLPGTGGVGVRKIEGIDGHRLRLFFLSILWRAAASSMHEFREVRMLPGERRRLARMILDQRATPLSFYPVMLFQLSTRGRFHNHSPIAQRKLRDPSHPEKGSIPFFRFYFDGLIVHIHRKDKPKEVAAMGPLMVGGRDVLAVTVRPFEGSWQEGNLGELIAEAEARWPEKLAKIERG
jgi:hypothetical protein